MSQQQQPPAPRPAGLNVVVLHGVLSRDPDHRVLPSGSALVAYEVSVVRSEGPAERVPVVWIDPPARLPNVAAGEAVSVVGRVRRRFFRAGGATQSRTEVVAAKVVPGRHRERARRAIEQALAEVLGDVAVAP